VQNVFYNTKLAPTDDVNYRKALCYLFDYNMIVNDVFVGSNLNYGPISSYTTGNEKTKQYEYNLDKAKEFLSKSKYADNYKDYPIEFLVISDVADLEKVALAFQSAARQVGITVDVKKAPWVTIQERVSTAESTPNVVSINSAPQYNEAGATLESGFHSKTAGTYENCHWAISEEMDKEIEDAVSIIDREERFKKYADIQNKIVDEIVPATWIADLTERVAYQSTYIEWPAAAASKSGNLDAYLMGYPFFFPDMKFISK
jgi:peptide/nickel transport system substrate-binding protein